MKKNELSLVTIEVGVNIFIISVFVKAVATFLSIIPLSEIATCAIIVSIIMGAIGILTFKTK